MGVLSCDRNECKNIMCDRLSHKYGYICYECFEELVNSGPTTDIKTFMKSEKNESSEEEAIGRYDKAFPATNLEE